MARRNNDVRNRTGFLYQKFVNQTKQSIFTETDIAKAAASDFVVFREFVCKQKTFPHQHGWIKALETGDSSELLDGIYGDRTLILAPRGSTKSTLLLQWVAFQIGRHISNGYALKVLYISYSLIVARQKSEQIQEIILRPEYQRVFPRVRRNKRRWGKDLWDVDRKIAQVSTIDEPYTLAAAGLIGTILSRRAHLVIFDDLIKSPIDIENPDVRDSMARNLVNAIYPTMILGQSRAVCLGTRMRADDIYSTHMTQMFNWHVIEESAIQVTGQGQEQSYCEELAPIVELRRTRLESPEAFEFQYQNKVPKSMQYRFDSSWIKKGIPRARFVQYGIGIDLAASKAKTADWTVFVLGARDDDGLIWILDMVRGRWAGNITKCNHILLMCLAWDLIELSEDTIYEVHEGGTIKWKDRFSSHFIKLDKDRIFQRQMVSIYHQKQGFEIQLAGDMDNYFVDTLGLDGFVRLPDQRRAEKMLLFKSTFAMYEREEVWFNKLSVLDQLETELKFAGQTQHDDCLDAITQLLRGFKARGNLDYA